MLVISLCLSGMAILTAAQESFDFKEFSKRTAESKSVFAPMDSPPDIDQCANGQQSAGAPQTCAGNRWQNGNLNENNSQWVEGQSVPYRVKFVGLSVGSTNNTITIGYDSTSGGKHTFDYLTTYNRSNPATPCEPTNAAICTAAPTTWPIPLDPNVSGAGVTQIGGQVFTMWGATITGVSAYTLNGDYNGTSETTITITFKADATTAVLAWGGHIATRADWGIGRSAVSIPGSDYHMRIGGQDRSMKIGAVIFPGSVTIIKEVQSFNGDNTFTTWFPFTTTNFNPATFQLRDINDPTEDRIVNSDIRLFGAANTITITEAQINGWSLQPDSACVETSGGLPNTVNSSLNIATRTATIVVEEGEDVVCTFKNLQVVPTAANATVSGRVSDANGSGVAGARLTIMNLNTGETKTVMTNPFGNYVIDELPVSDFYILTVNHRKMSFAESTRSFTLNDSLSRVDFVQNW